MSSSAEPSWLAEPPIGGFQQQAAITDHLYQGRSPYQSIAVCDTVPFGRALVLDGAVQTTIKDEFVYHEMLVHPAILAHPRPERALIIGGGDGGTLRRVLQHRVERATMVEIDRDVVNICLRYLPDIAAQAFEDARANLLIADGTRFLAETVERFDIVFVDSTDPVGPAKALFAVEFYRHIARALTADGLVVTQSGSPLLMHEELRCAAENLRQVFPFVRCYLANIPSYPGCLWSFLVAGKRPQLARFFSASADPRCRATISRRFARAALSTHCYTPELHFASFALPRHIQSRLGPGASA